MYYRLLTMGLYMFGQGYIGILQDIVCSYNSSLIAFYNRQAHEHVAKLKGHERETKICLVFIDIPEERKKLVFSGNSKGLIMMWNLNVKAHMPKQLRL